MSKKILTVAIPTYNGGDSLIEAVKSCEHLKIPKDDFEILVCDNASNDGSIDKLRNLTYKFPNVRIEINNTNIGRVGNWRRCINLSNSDYLIFLFTNDRIHYNNIVSELLKLMRNKNYPALMCNTLGITDRGKFLFYDKYEGEISLKEFIDKYFVEKMNFVSLGILQSYIFNLSVIKKYNITFREDIDRTTDRVFIFDVIRLGGGIFYKSNSILTEWILNHRRSHAKYHLSMYLSDFSEFYKHFHTIWIQEFLANMYILTNSGYSDKESLYLMYSYIKQELYIKRIKKIVASLLKKLKKFKSYEYEKLNYDYALEEVAYKVLITYLDITKHRNLTSIVKHEYIALKSVIKRLASKILKSIE